MARSIRVLIIDDDADIQVAARLALRPHVDDVVTIASARNLGVLLAQQRFDVVLLDMNLAPGATSGADGLKAMEELRAGARGSAVICMTAFGRIDVAVRAMKLGAIDFIEKPWSNDALVATVLAAARVPERAQGDGAATAFVGTSAAFERARALIAQCAPTEANILLIGETGTGKEVAAREIHRLSPRAKRPFVPIDLAALPETMIERELFGHRKGAFTDAKDDSPGLIAQAEGGTLFLDEIGNASLAAQAKLLAVLERREVTRLGDVKPRPVDIRIIAATNAPRAQLADPTRFRQDLLHRLATIEIALPPLRERDDDIETLSRYFVERYAQQIKRDAPAISLEAMGRLHAHEWPGNVRELRHTMERAMILSDARTIGREHIVLPHQRGEAAEERTGSALAKLERDAVNQALKRHNGNITRAAAELGITRASFYRRMEKYGL